MKHFNLIDNTCKKLLHFLSISVLLFISAQGWSNNIDTPDPAPVAIMSFIATPVDQHVKLDWALTGESDKYYYTIEKSLDGVNFEFVDKIDGDGAIKLHAIDENPWNGLSYYRLKQTGLDGKHSYSKIISVKANLGKNPDFFICPNPTSGGNLTLKFLNVSGVKINVKIFNIVGNEVFSQVIPVTSNSEFSATIQLPGELNSGTYLAKIDANNTSCTKRFILRKGN